MNNKLGIIYCSYSTKDLTELSLTPWLESGETISAVSFPFIGFPEQDNEENLSILRKIKDKYKENFISLHSGSQPVSEHYARNLALQDLLPNHEIIMILDSDECYAHGEIKKLKEYIYEEIDYNPIFKIEFKNLTFNNNTYTENFNPARVFKRNILDVYKLDRCYYDNNFIYKNLRTGEEMNDQQFLHKIVPKEVIQPLHHSWNNPARSKAKVKYQEQHFGYSSFKWNEIENKLEFNDDFFIKTNQKKPELKSL